jgi:hypothetical protein
MAPGMQKIMRAVVVLSSAMPGMQHWRISMGGLWFSASRPADVAISTSKSA